MERETAYIIDEMHKMAPFADRIEKFLTEKDYLRP